VIIKATINFLALLRSLKGGCRQVVVNASTCRKVSVSVGFIFLLCVGSATDPSAEPDLRDCLFLIITSCLFLANSVSIKRLSACFVELRPEPPVVGQIHCRCLPYSQERWTRLRLPTSRLYSSTLYSIGKTDGPSNGELALRIIASILWSATRE